MANKQLFFFGRTGGPRLISNIIDIEYNKSLDRRRPCLADELNGGSNNQYKVTNQFYAGDYKLYL